jgi:hypothetical protein
MRYDVARVHVMLKEERRTHLKFRDASVPATEYVYTVLDENYSQPARWDFLVRVPDTSTASTEVRPAMVPNVREWAGLDRKALMFQRATLGKHRGDMYCKVAVSDVSGEKTRIEAKDKTRLPYWFRAFGSRLRTKDSVRTTRGTDADALVVTVPRDDHAMMIRVFLAAKAWVLKEDFQF